MDKKGVDMQVFMWIFALILIALILFFGIRSLTDVMKVGNTVDVLTFQKDIEKQVELLYNYAPGSNKQIELRATNGLKGICFMDLSKPKGNILFPQVEKYKVMVGAKNLYYATIKGKEPEPVVIDHLVPKTNPVCKEVHAGMITFILENKGENVEVS